MPSGWAVISNQGTTVGLNNRIPEKPRLKLGQAVGTAFLPVPLLRQFSEVNEGSYLSGSYLSVSICTHKNQVFLD